MNIGTIIQARMGSTRLPGKALLKIGDKSMLIYLVKRLKNTKTVDFIVIATTDKEEDSCIVELAHKNNIDCFAGSENDVLDRFVKAGRKFGIQIIVRVCADNLFTDPGYIDSMVRYFLEKKPDYLSYRLFDGTPVILTGIGLFAEIVKLSALEKAHVLAKQKRYREHVTNFIYTHPNIFNIEFLTLEPSIEKAKLWLTVDTGDNLEMVRSIHSAFANADIDITCEQIIRFVNKHPSLKHKMEILHKTSKKKLLTKEGNL